MATRVIKGRNGFKSSLPTTVKESINKRTATANNQLSQVHKAETSVAIDDTNNDVNVSGISGNTLLPPPFNINGLQEMVQQSTILQQCITAYRRNIVGFGAVPQYKKSELQEKRIQLLATDEADREGKLVDDPDTPIREDLLEPGKKPVTQETAVMVNEWEAITDFTEFFNFETSFEEVAGDLIEDREITGNFYCEIVRNLDGQVVEGNRLNPTYIQCTAISDVVVQVAYVRNGRKVERGRKFRKYSQQVGGKQVWFKELGDPRFMDFETGEYHESLTSDRQANEIWHGKIGNDAYGLPRWIGQVVHMYGSRKAEELNLRYFETGRHVPMAIMVSNGTLSPQAEDQIEDYLSSIEGVENAHGFLVIESEGLPSDLSDGTVTNSKVEIKSLSDVIQKDALFLDYDAKSREKVQSAFRLPDIYVGRSADFNRATADTAKEITEEQVFNPERTQIEWLINHRILSDYEFQYTELKFKKPEASSIDEFKSVIELLLDGTSITTNELREVTGKYLGKEFDSLGVEYDVPTGSARRGSGMASPSAQALLSSVGNPITVEDKEDTKEELEELEELEKAFDSYYNQPSDSLITAVRQVIKDRGQ